MSCCQYKRTARHIPSQQGHRWTPVQRAGKAGACPFVERLWQHHLSQPVSSVSFSEPSFLPSRKKMATRNTTAAKQAPFARFGRVQASALGEEVVIHSFERQLQDDLKQEKQAAGRSGIQLSFRMSVARSTADLPTFLGSLHAAAAAWPCAI